MGKLNLNFSYTFNGKLWNIISHPQKELLLLEVRQNEKFLATFSLLDTSTGKFLFRDVEFEEKWWIGASYIIDDNILLHVYPDQDNPEVKDLFAYNFIEEKIIWKIKHKNIIDANVHYVSVLDQNHEEKEYYNILSGKRMEIPVKANVEALKKNKMLEASFHYREGSRHFDTIGRFLKVNTGNDAVKGVDYYENDKVIVISYYNWTENDKLDNDLLVVDHEGEQLLKIRLGSALSGISNDTFFIYYNKVIFVKDNSEFLIYQLP